MGAIEKGAEDALVEQGQIHKGEGLPEEMQQFQVEAKPVGLSAAELEKFRDDPFWKPVRTILYVLFWLLWIAMFVGAILIVVLSPKCSSAVKQEPQWWQEKVAYQIQTPVFFDTDGDGVGNIKGITEKIDILRKLGVTTVYATPLMELEKDNYFDESAVVSHSDVDVRYGTEEALKELIDELHSRDMYLVMDLPVASVSLKHKFITNGDFDALVGAKNGSPLFNEERLKALPDNTDFKFLPFEHDGETPAATLNWDSPKTEEVVFEAVKKLLDLGVDGFHIDDVSRLGYNDRLETDAAKATATVNKMVEFIQTHVSASDYKDKKIVLFSSRSHLDELVPKDLAHRGMLDFALDQDFARISNLSCPNLADCVMKTLNKVEELSKKDKFASSWQFETDDSSRLASRFDKPTAELMNFLQLLLPGAITLQYGQELGLRDAAGSSAGKHAVMQWTAARDDHHGFVSGRTEEQGPLKEIFFAESGGDDETDNYESRWSDPTSLVKTLSKLSLLRQRDEALIVGEFVVAREADVIFVSRFVRNNRTENGTEVGWDEAARTAYIAVLNFGDSDVSVTSELIEEAAGNDGSNADLVPENKNLKAVQVSAVSGALHDTYMGKKQKFDLTKNGLGLPAKQAILLKL